MLGVFASPHPTRNSSHILIQHRATPEDKPAHQPHEDDDDDDDGEDEDGEDDDDDDNDDAFKR